MPRIDDNAFSSSKSFKKKNYRPWNLLDADIGTGVNTREDETEKAILGKQKTIKKQIEHKPNTNWTQTEHKLGTNRTQTEHKEKETEHKLDTEPNTTSDTNRTQTEHKLDTNINFSSLVGLQRKLILLIYENCKIARSKITEPLTLEYISEQIKIPLGSIKTTIRRLEMKGYVKRIEYKNGRSGWSKYEIPKNIFNEMLQNETGHKLDTNWTQTGHKLDTKAYTEPNTTPSSSSGNINILNKNTTTTSDEWNELDIIPLQNFGFTKNHLLQIATQNKLSHQVVQDSIYAFAFDLTENGKSKNIKCDPVNYFMGILRNGQPYAPPSNYESPQDKAMRIYTERMQATEQKRVETEQKALNFAFKDWFSKLSEEALRAFLPPLWKKSKLEDNKMLESLAKNHFEKEVWLELKNQIEIGTVLNSEG